MPEDEKNKLLDEDDDDKDYERVISKRRVLLVCCCCCFGVVVIFIFVRIIMALLETHSCHRSEETLFPKNLTEFLSQNQQLCEKVRGKDAAKANTAVTNPANIYVIKNTFNLTVKQACSVESILRLFPDKTIYIIDFDKVQKVDLDRSEYRPTYIQLLLYLYKDRLQLVNANKKEFFKDTPFHNISREDENFDFLTMLVTAYKYGGFVATPDLVMTSREFVECFPEDTIIEPFIIMTSRTCDESLYYLMESFILCDRHLSLSLDQMLTKSAELYTSSLPSGRRTLRRLLPYEICSSTKLPCQIFKLEESNVEESKWITDLSPFCKQVVQACLGLRLNKMQVEEETSRMKSSILENGNGSCSNAKKGFEICD